MASSQQSKRTDNKQSSVEVRIMPSTVKPNEVPVRGDHEMTSSISDQATTNDALVTDDLTSEQENVNEQWLKEIDEIYSPLLKVMALFGTYFGDTSLKHLPHVSGRKGKWGYLLHIYCVVVVSGFWLNFIMSFADIFLGNNIYLFLMFSLWCLLIALSGTICLIVLCKPLADSRKSRFENFLHNLLAINSNVNLEKVKSKSKKGIIIFCFLSISAAISFIVTYLLLDISVAASKPWNQWFAFKILFLIFFTYGMGVWLIPILFLYITCLILQELFEDLRKRTSVLVDIGTFKMEHYRLCEVVEIADKMLAPLLCGIVSLCIPLICFNFYTAINLPEEDKFVFLITNLFWLVSAASILAIILSFGSKVCEKIHGFQKILQTSLFSNEDEGKVFTAIQMVSFKLDLQGDPKGLSIGGLVIITRSTSLTIVGAIVSYFAVMLSLPK